MNERTDQYSLNVPDREGEIDVYLLWQIIWKGKLLILTITLIITIAAVAIALYLKDMYKADVLLAPITQQQNQLSTLSNQFKGLASLAGANLSSVEGDKVTLATEIIKSRKFITEYIKAHDILIPLFAVDGWDREKDKLIYDDDIYDSEKQKWTRKVRAPKKPIPSDWEAYLEFQEILSVSRDEDTGFVRISIEFYSPNVAKQWVDWLVEDINRVMREKDIKEATQSIAYLENQLEKTQVAEIKNIFFKLIENEMRKVLLAETKTEYIFEVIDPAVAPLEKSRPKRVLIVIMGFLLGSFLGIFWVLVKYSLGQSHGGVSDTEVKS
ncbi:Wzz/FepE/Etk N-terminal domain-containing protein [Luteithermobacter gelatinilyticus]|uniref:Wzz/FepE/Etk N-terminal domain-containing protein n=1 Tax=Luteithermobacter gelatinilyticus TaxID=2582913 RepID=UPI0011062A7D|nr:Wzz/FepE/Etk N-terminal domain-containing protein [Luteithermobacter gelatinilyticus]